MRKLKSPIIYVFSSQVVEKECKLLYDNLEFGSKNGVTLENTGLRRFLCMALWHLF